jgi:L-alanine-DL-glutamate epimerase-like enolase superfamily enzyme
MDAQNTDVVYERLYHLNHVRGHTASFTIDAIATLDIALWDIKGKVVDKAVSQILGVAKSELPLYVSGLRRGSQEERKALAKQVVTEGYSGVKLFFGSTAEETVQECAAIRESIGSEALLAFDAICRHNFTAAQQIGRGLDALNAAWFESPLDPEDVAAHARLAQSIQTPVAVGEPLRTVREFEPWLNQKALQIAQPDIVRCGITGGLRIIDAVHKKGLQTAPHIGVCTAVGMAATWHVTAVLPYAVPQEHQLDMFPVANKVLTTPLLVENGRAIVPRNPGLGIEVNEDFVKAHSADQWRIDASGIVYHSGKL